MRALACLVLLVACGPSPSSDAGFPGDAASADASSPYDAGHDAGADGGPVECPASCQGDHRCGGDGRCVRWPDGEYDLACATNLTIRFYTCTDTFAAWEHVSATVCNRGSAEAASGQLVRFERDAEVICEASTDAPIAPGGCADVVCPLSAPLGEIAPDHLVRATVNPDGLALECGDPLDNSMEAGVALGCE